MARRGPTIDGARQSRTSDRAKRAWYYRRRMERYAALLADPDRLHALAAIADRVTVTVSYQFEMGGVR